MRPRERQWFTQNRPPCGVDMIRADKARRPPTHLLGLRYVVSLRYVQEPNHTIHAPTPRHSSIKSYVIKIVIDSVTLLRLPRLVLVCPSVGVPANRNCTGGYSCDWRPTFCYTSPFAPLQFESLQALPKPPGSWCRHARFASR